jgi:ParB-like chromosome segregation protein Spo0J
MTVARSDNAAENELALLYSSHSQKVPIDSLYMGDSPRLDGEDSQHIQLLAELDGVLPPILVQRGTMRVIDGRHRIQAALQRGQADIEVTFFDGAGDDVFIIAVKRNNAHGLPLTVADREAAAARIIASHAQRSDRWIADIVGLAPVTVATIRCRVGADESQITARIGRDGRSRPLSSGGSRQLARDLMNQRPDASLREIARMAGISPSTALDVRRRLLRGDDPVPLRQAGGNGEKTTAATPIGRKKSRRSTPSGKLKDRQTLLRELKRDPSLRYTESGRALLRLLHNMVDQTSKSKQLIDSSPPHCGHAIAQVLRQCADEWLCMAGQMEDGRNMRAESTYAEEVAHQATSAT